MLCLEASKRVIKLSVKLETLVSKFVPADPEFNFLIVGDCVLIINTTKTWFHDKLNSLNFIVLVLVA